MLSILKKFKYSQILEKKDNTKGIIGNVKYNNPFHKITEKDVKKVFTEYNAQVRDNVLLKNSTDEVAKSMEMAKMSNKQYAASLPNSQRAFKNLIKDAGDTKLTLEDMQGALVNTSSGFGALASKAGSFIKSMALNIGIMVAVTATIHAITWAIDALVTTQKEMEEKAELSVKAYKNTKDELEKLNEELDTNKDKTQELQSKGTLSLVEQAELDKLEETNKKLERQIKLKEDLLIKQAKEAAEDTADVMNKYNFVGDTTNGVQGSITGSTAESYKQAYFNNPNFENLVEDTNLPAQIALYEKYNEVMKSVAESTEEYNTANEKANNAQQNLIDAMGDIESNMLNMEEAYNFITQKKNNYQPLTSSDRYIINQYEALQRQFKEIQKVLYPEDYYNDKLDEIFKVDNIEYTKEQLTQLARAGKLEELDFNKLTYLSAAIAEAGISVEDFRNSIYSLINIDTSITPTEQHLSNLKDRIDDIDSANLSEYAKTLKDVYKISNDNKEIADLIASDYTLTDEAVKSLIETFDDYGDALKKSKKETPEYIKGISAIVQTINNLTGLNNVDSDFVIDNLSTIKDIVDGDLNALDDLRRKLAYKYVISIATDLKDEELKGQLDVLQQQILDFENNNDIKVGAAIEDADFINTLNEMMKNGKIAADEVNKYLSNMGYEAKISYVDMNVPSIAYQKHSAGLVPTDSLMGNDFGSLIPKVSKVKVPFPQINSVSKKASSSTVVSPSTKSSGSSGSSSSNTTKSYNWIEKAIDKVRREINKLDKVINSSYNTWSNRNKAIVDEMSEIQKEISLNGKAYDAYMKKANSVGLSSSYISKIQDGKIQIEDIKDEKLQDKIDKYTEWYEAALSVKESTEELEEQLKDLTKLKFDNIVSEYEGSLNSIESRASLLETVIDTQELKGFTESVKYYESLLQTNNDTLSTLKKERSALLSSLSEAVQTNMIKENTEAWYDMRSQIDEVTQAIYDAEQSTQEFKNTIEEISWDNFDKVHEKINDIISESEFLNELLSGSEMFNDNGELTNKGLTSMALYGINYNTYMAQADEYAKAIKELDEQYKDDSLNERYLERRKELLETQRDLIQNAQNEKQNMIDLAEEGYDKMLESLNELIDKRKELLTQSQSIYEYEKDIAEKTKTVTNLQKQLSAYNGDDSEESKKTVQQLKVQLQDAQDDLRESEYDKFISDQEQLLDNIVTETERWIDERITHQEELLEDIIEEVNAGSKIVDETIKSESAKVGYSLTEPMKEILGENGTNISSPITSMLSTYNQNFTNTMTTLINAVNGIKSAVSKQNDVSDSNATAQIDTSSKDSKLPETVIKDSSASAPSNSTNNNSNSNSNSTNTNTNSNNNVFEYSKYQYSKKNLDYKKSILDALKYFDYAYSFSKRKTYYKKLGYNDEYLGTSKQNTILLNALKKVEGFSRGGLVGELKQIARFNSDDSIVLNSFHRGESVFDVSTTEQLIKFNQNADKFANLMDFATLEKAPSQTIIQQSFDGLSIELPNVKDFKDFKNELMGDGDFRKFIFQTTDSNYSNNGKLGYKKFIK